MNPSQRRCAAALEATLGRQGEAGGGEEERGMQCVCMNHIGPYNVANDRSRKQDARRSKCSCGGYRLAKCCYNPETSSIPSPLVFKILFLLPRHRSCFCCWDPCCSIKKQQQQACFNSSNSSPENAPPLAHSQHTALWLGSMAEVGLDLRLPGPESSS